MDIQEDKKLILAVWGFLRPYRSWRILFSLLSTYLFCGTTNQEFRILDNFKDGGIIFFILLMAVPYFISTWAVAFDMNMESVRKAVFMTLASFVATSFFLVGGDVYHPITQAFLSLSPIILFWVWLFLFRSSFFKKEKVS